MFQQFPTRSLFLVVFFKDYSIFSLFFFKSTYSEYYPIIKMNNIFNLFYTFYEYVLNTAHYFWLSEKHRKVFFIICIHSFRSICIRRQYFKPKCTIVFLHGLLIYLPARVHNQVYKGKYHFDGVSFETPH